jgi:transcriptional regulator with XRE-family HTH domain
MKEQFSGFINKHMVRRSWNMAELCRRSDLTLPELSRVMSGSRPPSMRIIVSLAKAFSEASYRDGEDGLDGFDSWAGRLVRLTAHSKGYKTPQ